MEKKSKNLVYCRVQMLQKKSPDLQTALVKAFDSKPLAKDRFERIGFDEDQQQVVRFVNDHPEWRGMRFGSVLMYSPGKNQHVMGLDDEAEELPVAQLAPPPDDTGNRREFLESVLYFGVLGNHVILCQSQALKARAMDDHLNWLLRETQSLDKNNGLTLVRELDVDLREQASKTPVKRVTIGRMLVEDAEVDETAPKRRRHQTLRAAGVGVDILRRLVDERVLKADEVDLARLAGEDDLRIEVSLSYLGRHRDDLDHALRSIVGAAQHADEEDIRVEFKNGKARNGKLFVTASRRIQHVNGLVDPEDMWSSMHEQLSEWLEQGQI